MSTEPHNLIEALQGADMLEIDGLHAWRFELDKELLAQVSAGSADADSQDEAVLSIECLDGRLRRQWRFSLAEVLAARLDPNDRSWRIEQGESQHRVQCFAAVRADSDDEDPTPGDDDSPT